MTAKSKIKGREVKYVKNKWIYSDTKKPVKIPFKKEDTYKTIKDDFDITFNTKWRVSWPNSEMKKVSKLIFQALKKNKIKVKWEEIK